MAGPSFISTDTSTWFPRAGMDEGPLGGMQGRPHLRARQRRHEGGIAAAVYAAEAIRRAGVRLRGGRGQRHVDEGSGGSRASLSRRAEDTSEGRTDYVIIPEPHSRDRICSAPRRLLVQVTTAGTHRAREHAVPGGERDRAHGARAGGSPSRAKPALAERITRCRSNLPAPATRRSTSTRSREAVVEDVQTPCVADCCRAVFDRRFLLEEGFDRAQAEVVELLERTARAHSGPALPAADLMVVHPVRRPQDSPLMAALERSIHGAGREATIMASPGTYDQNTWPHRGIPHCVSYGPGILELAHQPDEYIEIRPHQFHARPGPQRCSTSPEWRRPPAECSCRWRRRCMLADVGGGQ